MRTVLLSSLTALCVGACGSASYVKQDERAGQIALEGSYMHSMRKAKQMAADHCDGRYEVVESAARLDYACVDNRVSIAK